MTVERIPMPAVRYLDERGQTRHQVLIPDPAGDGGWCTLNEDGMTYWADAADVRKFADDWAADPERRATEDEAIEAYRALADLIAEQHP